MRALLNNLMSSLLGFRFYLWGLQRHQTDLISIMKNIVMLIVDDVGVGVVNCGDDDDDDSVDNVQFGLTVGSNLFLHCTAC